LRTFLHILLLVAFSFPLAGQHAIGKREYRWALGHPFAALKIRKKLPVATAIYKAVQKEGVLDRYESGGKADAFRHAFTMAYLAQTIGTKKLRKLGQAHEKTNYRDYRRQKLEDGERADSLASEMDLRNNELGFAIGKANPTLGTDSLKNLVIAAILRGEAWYLKRNAAGNYTNCEGQELRIGDYAGQWFVPKCLIKTNE